MPGHTDRVEIPQKGGYVCLHCIGIQLQTEELDSLLFFPVLNTNMKSQLDSFEH